MVTKRNIYTLKTLPHTLSDGNMGSTHFPTWSSLCIYTWVHYLWNCKYKRKKLYITFAHHTQCNASEFWLDLATSFTVTHFWMYFKTSKKLIFPLVMLIPHVGIAFPVSIAMTILVPYTFSKIRCSSVQSPWLPTHSVCLRSPFLGHKLELINSSWNHWLYCSTKL